MPVRRQPGTSCAFAFRSKPPAAVPPCLPRGSDRGRPKRGWCWLLLWLALPLEFGCVSYAQRIDRMRLAYQRQDVEAAVAIVAEAAQRDRYNVDVLKLDRALIELTAGQPQAAERTLREVREAFDRLEAGASANQAFSYLTDDQRRDYLGEDYEKVLLRAFLALSNLMHDGSDAEAYCLQMVDKQEQLIEAGLQEDGSNPKATYQRVALAPYLRGILREATHRDYDDAERAYAAVCDWCPGFRFGRENLARAALGRHSQPGHGVLHVIALTGRGPWKREAIEEPTSVSLLLAGEILSTVGRQTVPPNIAPVKVPQVVTGHSIVQSVGVDLDSRPIAATETITDIGQLAIQQYQAIYPIVIARAVARRCVKMGLIYGAKEAAGVEKSSLPSLAVDLAGIAWEATEKADTRCWGLLPDKIQVLRLELPAGQYQLTLRPLGSRAQPVGPPATCTVQIQDGRNTYLLGSFPEAQLAGKLLSNCP